MAYSEDPEDYAPAAHRVRSGTLLLANTDLLEPTFRRSVIYIVEHNDGGTLGVVLNRPSETAVYNVLPQWAKLAAKYDGKDRWYLEALGIASDLNAEACFAAYQEEMSKLDQVPNVAAYNDIVWRTRSKACLPLLVKIITAKETKEDDKPRYLRAFDFHPKSAEKDKALAELLAE